MRDTLFDLQGQTAVITGGGGVLGRVMAHALAGAGARVAVISLHETSSAKVAEGIRAAGGEAIGIACDVMDKAALELAREEIARKFSSIDILINAAGGNQPQATTSPERSFFDLDVHAIDSVLRLNFTSELSGFWEGHGRARAWQYRECRLYECTTSFDAHTSL
jgi:NAD(P)-dependent dehydrogenase (short-subunit alcohol dehydrogenase family)